MKGIPEPVNATEAYLYAMTVRLDALCNMVSSLVEHIADEKGVAVEKSTETLDTQCTAETKSGNRCKSKAIEGTNLCAVHTKKGDVK